MRAALYTRVSSREQVEGFSLAAQEKALKDYCLKNAIEIFNLYSDEGIPGSKEERPQFQNMIKDASKHKFDMVLVHKFDRFARKVELSQKVKNIFRKLSISVISITEPIEDSPIGFFQEGMLELLSEYYIKNLSAEVKKGQREKISQGKACNMMAYGYKNLKGKVEIVPEQADIVRLIFKMYNEGNGTYIIARYLNDNGIKTLKTGIWNNKQINYIIRNITYTGALKWSNNIYEDVFPAIIDKEYFESTQKKIITPKGLKRKEYYNKFLLLGLLRCGECGGIMRISKMKSNGGKVKKTGAEPKIYYYYSCAVHRYDKKSCNSGIMYNYKDVDKLFIETYKSNVVDIYIPSEKTKPDNRINKIQDELTRAETAYLEKVFTLEQYARIKNKLEFEMSQIKTRPAVTYEKIKILWEEFNSTQSIIRKKAILQEVIKEIKILRTGLDIELHD